MLNIYILTLKSPQESVERWYFFVIFEQEGLIKYYVERELQRHIILDIVVWFPNFWVRKLFVVKEKWTN